jgi:hypothetical protein
MIFSSAPHVYGVLQRAERQDSRSVSRLFLHAGFAAGKTQGLRSWKSFSNN